MRTHRYMHIIVELIFNMLLITRTLFALFNLKKQPCKVHREMSAEQLTRSFGSFITLFSAVKYLEHYPEFYMLIIAVRGS